MHGLLQLVRKYDQAIVILKAMEIILKTSEEILWNIGAAVAFNNEIKLTQKKDSFLWNAVNKQNIINMLCGYLQLSGCKVLHAADDNDLPVVQSAEHLITILVVDDTDCVLHLYVTTPTL